MRNLLAVIVIGAMLFVVGCGALSMPTDQASPIVQKLDQILGVTKDTHGVVTKTPTTDPTGGTIPYVGTALGVLSFAWYAIRKLSTSVPAATMDNAVNAHADSTNKQTEALANSTPTSIQTTVPMVQPVAVQTPAPKPAVQGS
jgi:hypothetical protein